MQLFGGGVRYLTEKDMANTSVGVNLYQGTKDFSGTNWVFSGGHSKVNPYSAIKNAYLDFTALEVNASWGGARQDILANSGETYTFSGFIKKGNGNPNVTFYGDAQGITNIGNVDSEGKSINITDGWSKFSITFSVTAGGIIQPRIESNNGGPNVTYFIAGLKLERGAVPTQWSPAPQDLVLKSDAQLLEQGISNLNKLLGPVLSSNIKRLGKTDLNNLPSGWCLVTDSASSNWPASVHDWCICFTLYVTDTGADRFQIAIAYNTTDCNIYVRTCGGTPPQWITWKKISYSA